MIGTIALIFHEQQGDIGPLCRRYMSHLLSLYMSCFDIYQLDNFRL